MALKRLAPNATWTLRDVTTSARGARSAALLAGGATLDFTLGEPGAELSTPFGASSFGEKEATGGPGPTRLTIDWSVAPETEEVFAAIDRWTVEYLAKESERLLRKRLSVETVRAQYKPLVKPHGEYRSTLRMKFNTTGKHALRCWDPRGNRRELPEEWRGLACTVRATLSHLWIMGASFGWTLSMTDALLREEEARCPFAVQEAQDEAQDEAEEGDASGGGGC